MATPPTFVAEYETAVNVSTSPKTVSVTTQVGDVLVVLATAENRTMTLGTPSGGTGLSWTAHPQVTNTPTSDWCTARAWSATATTAETFNLSVARTAGDTSQFWGFIVLHWRNSGGIGSVSTSAASGAAPSRTLSCSANSAVMCVIGDWNALASARTWRTINGSVGTEQMYVNVAGRYTAYANRWDDVGSAGTRTLGMTDPSTQKYSLAAVEVLGTVGGSPQTVTPTGIASGQALGSVAVSTSTTVSPTGIASGQGVGAPVVSPGVATVSPTGVSSGQALGAPAVSSGVSVSPGGISSGVVVGTPSVSTAITVSPTGVGTGVAVGTPSISGPQTVAPTGIASGQALGTPTVSSPTTVGPTGVGPAASPGTPSVSAVVVVSPSSVASSLAVGIPSVQDPFPVDSNLPWSLQIDVPWRTLDVDIPRRTLDVDIPGGRTIDVEIPGGRTLEVDIPQLTLEVDIPQRELEIDL